MIMRFTLFFISALVLFVACKKDEPISEPIVVMVPPVIELGKSSMLKDGQQWSIPLTARWFKSFNGIQTLSIIGKRYLSNGLIEETIAFVDVMPQKGKFLFSCSCDQQSIAVDGIPEVLISWIVDEDQLAGTMKIDTTKTGNYIEIIKYDSVARTIEGQFQVHMKNRSSGPLPWSLPNEVFISEGKFNLKIE